MRATDSVNSFNSPATWNNGQVVGTTVETEMTSIIRGMFAAVCMMAFLFTILPLTASAQEGGRRRDSDMGGEAVMVADPQASDGSKGMPREVKMETGTEGPGDQNARLEAERENREAEAAKKAGEAVVTKRLKVACTTTEQTACPHGCVTLELYGATGHVAKTLHDCAEWPCVIEGNFPAKHRLDVMVKLGNATNDYEQRTVLLKGDAEELPVFLDGLNPKATGKQCSKYVPPSIPLPACVFAVGKGGSGTATDFIDVVFLASSEAGALCTVPPDQNVPFVKAYPDGWCSVKLNAEKFYITEGFVRCDQIGVPIPPPPLLVVAAAPAQVSQPPERDHLDGAVFASPVFTSLVTVETCGDGHLDTDKGEACDDGNTKEGDGCSADCKTRAPMYVCEPPGQLCTHRKFCGNGLENPFMSERDRVPGSEDLTWEACDKGATCNDGTPCSTTSKEASCADGGICVPKSGDGCSASCEVEEGWECSWEQTNNQRDRYTSKCAPVCGDGKVVRGEVCDDSNKQDNDYCSADCKHNRSVCGDGKQELNEVCDDGNKDEGDYCSADCSSVTGFCGDGALQAAVEQCDDRNTQNGDGCSAQCTTEITRPAVASAPTSDKQEPLHISFEAVLAFAVVPGFTKAVQLGLEVTPELGSTFALDVGLAVNMRPPQSEGTSHTLRFEWQWLPGGNSDSGGSAESGVVGAGYGYCFFGDSWCLYGKLNYIRFSAGKGLIQFPDGHTEDEIKADALGVTVTTQWFLPWKGWFITLDAGGAGVVRQQGFLDLSGFGYLLFGLGFRLELL